MEQKQRGEGRKKLAAIEKEGGGKTAGVEKPPQKKEKKHKLFPSLLGSEKGGERKQFETANIVKKTLLRKLFEHKQKKNIELCLSKSRMMDLALCMCTVG